MDKKKKAQIHMTETIAVLFIFFILVSLGIVFYYKYSQVAFKEKQQELLANRAIETVLYTLFLPELECSKGEAESEDNCVDVMKLRQANNTFLKYLDDYYFDLFSFSTIMVHQTYPKNQTWVIYDKKKVKTLENGTVVPDWTTKLSTFTVITLRDDLAIEGRSVYNLGYLNVTVYS